jgi:hypothetical protein
MGAISRPGSASPVFGTSIAGKNDTQRQPWISAAILLRAGCSVRDQMSHRETREAG